MDLLAWYNLIFVAPVGLAAVYLALSAVGLGDLSGQADTDVDADVDADLDHDLDLDVGHDVDMDMDHDLDVDMDHDLDVDMDHDVDVALEHDLDADLDHDLDVGHEVDVEHAVEVDHGVEAAHDVHAHDLGAEHEVHDAFADHGPSLLIRALSLLGFGKVPVSILMTCLMVIFGATGLIANGLFDSVLPWSWAPAIYFWPSLALALLVSLSLTGTVARGLSRVMPTKETYAVTEEELVGQVGVSVYGITDERRGPVNVKDTGGTLHQVMGRSMDGAVTKGTEVLLVRYHRKEDYYDVAASPLTAIAASAQEGVRTRPEATATEDSAARGRSADDVKAAGDRERTSSTQS